MLFCKLTYSIYMYIYIKTLPFVVYFSLNFILLETVEEKSSLLFENAISFFTHNYFVNSIYVLIIVKLFIND